MPKSPPIKTKSGLKPGGARVSVAWGHDTHCIVLTPRNWALVKRGNSLTVRARGFSEVGFQWEYWRFEGGMDGNLIVEYGEDGGQGFEGALSEAEIEEGQ